METKSDSSLVSQLITSEKLTYKLPLSSTVVQEKQISEYYADRTSYGPSEKIIFTLNTGSTFVNPKNCSLVLRLNAPRAGTCDFATAAQSIGFGVGGASAINVINRIRILSKGGQVLEDIQEVNALAAVKVRYGMTQSAFQKTASMIGVCPTSTATVPSAADILSAQLTDLVSNAGAADTGAYYDIPLYLISGLFDVDSLLPPQVMAGLRIEISTETFVKAFVNGATAAATTYTVGNPLIRCEQCKVSDAVSNAIMTQAANHGLMIPIRTYNTISYTSGTETAYRLDVKSNLSQCNNIVVKARTVAALTTGASDSMASESNNFSDYYFRLGSQYIPSSKIDRKVEMYKLAIDALHAKDCSVSLYDYNTLGCCVLAQDLERSALEGSLSGVSLSNSRVLSFQSSNNGVARQIDMFVNYTRVINAFIDNLFTEE